MLILQAKIPQRSHALDPAAINLLVVAADGKYRVSPSYAPK
jgi:hypothetical protein